MARSGPLRSNAHQHCEEVQDGRGEHTDVDVQFGEQPRWHDGRDWFSDWGPPEIIAVDLEGNSEVMLGAPSFPAASTGCRTGACSWSPRDGRLMRREPDGSMVTHGDLTLASDPPAGNELVVDCRGNAYVNGGGFDLMAGEQFAPGVIALVRPDGSSSKSPTTSPSRTACTSPATGRR